MSTFSNNSSSHLKLIRIALFLLLVLEAFTHLFGQEHRRAPTYLAWNQKAHFLFVASGPLDWWFLILAVDVLQQLLLLLLQLVLRDIFIFPLHAIEKKQERTLKIWKIVFTKNKK